MGDLSLLLCIFFGSLHFFFFPLPVHFISVPLLFFFLLCASSSPSSFRFIPATSLCLFLSVCLASSLSLSVPRAGAFVGGELAVLQ